MIWVEIAQLNQGDWVIGWIFHKNNYIYALCENSAQKFQILNTTN